MKGKQHEACCESEVVSFRDLHSCYESLDKLKSGVFTVFFFPLIHSLGLIHGGFKATLCSYIPTYLNSYRADVGGNESEFSLLFY